MMSASEKRANRAKRANVRKTSRTLCGGGEKSIKPAHTNTECSCRVAKRCSGRKTLPAARHNTSSTRQHFECHGPGFGLRYRSGGHCGTLVFSKGGANQLEKGTNAEAVP